MNHVAIKTHEMLEENGIPITGVSIGKVDDKKTWRVDFMDEATLVHHVQAQQLIDAFDPDAVPDPISEIESLKAQVAELTSQLNAIPLEK